MNRRSFINKAGRYSVAGLVASSFACKEASDTTNDVATEVAGTMADLSDGIPGMMHLENVGVQLYSLRSIIDGNFPEILERVANAGYQELEFAGYHGHSADELRVLCEKLSLNPVSTHISIDELEKDMDASIGFAADLGIDYLTCPWVAEDRRNPKSYVAMASLFNKVGAACQAKGINFAYHNHDFEFIEYDGKAGYDILLDACDPDLVQQEIDLYWITKAGADPLAYFDKYPGIFHLCHVKDMSNMDSSQDIATVGTGGIDFAKIFAAENSGLKHFIVEHDNPVNPIESITDSRSYLAGLHF